jgi:hypothetical protein
VLSKVFEIPEETGPLDDVIVVAFVVDELVAVDVAGKGGEMINFSI